MLACYGADNCTRMDTQRCTVTVFIVCKCFNHNRISSMLKKQFIASLQYLKAICTPIVALQAPHALVCYSYIHVFCKFCISSGVPAYDVIYFSIDGILCQNCFSIFGPQLATYTMKQTAKTNSHFVLAQGRMQRTDVITQRHIQL